MVKQGSAGGVTWSQRGAHERSDPYVSWALDRILDGEITALFFGGQL